MSSSSFLPFIVLGCALMMGSSLAQNPIVNANLGNLLLQQQQQQQQAQQVQQAAQVQQARRQQILAVGNEFGSYPHMGRLVNELENNEKSLAELEYDQSSLQAKISKSKMELAHHNNIVETLEEKQRLQIGALQGKVQGLHRYIANLEVTKEELRQKLLAATQKSIYGDSQLVAKVQEFQQKNQLLKAHSRQLVAKIHQLVNGGALAYGGLLRHPLDLNGDGLVDLGEAGLSADTAAQAQLLEELSVGLPASQQQLNLLLAEQAANAAAVTNAAAVAVSPSLDYLLSKHHRHHLGKKHYNPLKSLGLLPTYYNPLNPLDLNGDGLVDLQEAGLSVDAAQVLEDY